nr:hypothetical protein [Tanacetum cinerariifolium]
MLFVITFLCTPDARVYAKYHVQSAGCGLGIAQKWLRKCKCRVRHECDEGFYLMEHIFKLARRITLN